MARHILTNFNILVLRGNPSEDKLSNNINTVKVSEASFCYEKHCIFSSVIGKENTVLLSSSITDEEQRHGFMWLGLESSLWNVMTNHVKPETHTSVSLKENQMLLQIIDCKTEQYIIPLSFLLASHGARLWQDYNTKDMS